MPALQITPLPTAPSRADPTNFAARGDALLGALAQFVTETNALSTDVVAKSATATAAAAAADQSKIDAATQTAAAIATAQAHATAAANGSTAPMWVSGTNYADGVTVWSPANRKTYRKVGAGVSTVDPASDSAGAWTSPIAVPGTGADTVNVAANTTKIASASAALQILNPQGMGVSVQLPPATTIGAAVAAAYISNTNSPYNQLGIRDGAGTLKMVLPAGASALLAVSDSTTAAGKLEQLNTFTDDGLLAQYEVTLGGWSFLAFTPNIPTSTATYSRATLILSNSLHIALVVNGASVGVVAFNPQTGQLGSVTTLSTAYNTDTFFRLEKISATRFAVVWGKNATLTSSQVTARVADVSGLAFTWGTAVSLPTSSIVIGDINALVMSNGANIAISLKPNASNTPQYSYFGLSGTTLTAGPAPSAVAGGPSIYCSGYAPQLAEIGPTVFGVAGFAASGAGWLGVYTIGAGTLSGASTQATTNSATATPGSGLLGKIPGTTRFVWYCVPNTSTFGTPNTQLFDITTAGVVSFVAGKSASTYYSGQYYGGSPTQRPAWQSVSGTYNGILVSSNSAGADGNATAAFYYDNGTGGVTYNSPNYGNGVYELGGLAAGGFFIHVSQTLAKVVFDQTSGNVTNAYSANNYYIPPSGTPSYGTLKYGTEVNGVPVFMTTSTYYGIMRKTKISAIQRMPSSGFPSYTGMPYGFDVAGGFLVIVDTAGSRFRVLEVAQ